MSKIEKATNRLKRKAYDRLFVGAVLQHNCKGNTIDIDKTPFSIGRGKENNYVITDLAISRIHCAFIFEEDSTQWTVTDSSSSGVLLNGSKLKPRSYHKIHNGDIVGLGASEEYTYTFICDEIDENIPLNKLVAEQKKKIKVEHIESPEIEDMQVKIKDLSNKVLSLEAELAGFVKFRDTVESNLSCVICNELYIKATTLNCAHTFCKSCLDQWKKTKRECPVCRTRIATEEHMFAYDNLITSYIENSSEEIRNKREEVVEERAAQELLSKQATSSGRRRAPGRPPQAGNRRTTRSSRVTAGRAPRRAAARQNTAHSDSIIVVDDSIPYEEEDSPMSDLSSIFIDITSDMSSDEEDEIDVLLDDSDFDSFSDSSHPVSRRNEYVEGLPDASYGGYGHCYRCGATGHWAPGCPER